MARVTKEELLRLQKLYKTDAKIGAQFGISRQAVHQLRVKYSIYSLTEKNKDRDDQIYSQYESGMAGTELAKLHQLSISQTYRIINKMKATKKEEKEVAKLEEEKSTETDPITASLNYTSSNQHLS